MTKIRDKLIERRKFIRLETPIKVAYTVPSSNTTYTTAAKNISADGIRIETFDKTIEPPQMLEIKMDMEGLANPIHANGKVIWKKKLSLEDAAPFDLGVEFVAIEDDNKNSFLKFLCDLIYSLHREDGYAKHK